MKKSDSTRQEGAAMVTVLGIVAVVSIVCGMLSTSASRQARSSQITREMLRARMVAESGLNKAYCAVKSDFSLAQSYSQTETFDGGTYTVKSSMLGGADGNRAQLVSVGVYGLGRSVVSADLENRPKTEGVITNDYYSLAYDLLVGGVLTLKGNFNAEVTAIHANGNADLSGSASVEGDTVSSSGTVTWKKAPENVTLLSDQPAQEIFTEALATALNALKAYAEANGAVYATGADIPASPPGGVAYCTGSDSGWSGVGTGCFIFAGDFSTKHMTVASVDGYPALVVLSANSVQFNAGTEIHGAVILPTSSLKFNGHASIYGPLLVGQGATGNGTADLYAGNGQGFSLPPQAEVTDRLVITAWH